MPTNSGKVRKLHFPKLVGMLNQYLLRYLLLNAILYYTISFCHFSLVLIEGNILGQERSPATLYDPRIVEMPLDSLYQRFETIPVACYYPLIQIKSEIIAKSEPPPYNATGLPLIIKERDPEYQFHRVILFRRLLYVSITSICKIKFYMLNFKIKF